MTGDTLGERIRRAREQKRLSQRDLADLLDVSTRTLGNWENGRNHPRNSLAALERALGVRLEGPAVTEGDPVEVAVRSSRLTEDRQYDVIGYYKKRLREQDYEDEGRRGA